MADEAIKSLAVKIALDDGSFSQGMKNLKTQMNVVDSQFKSSVAGVKNWGSSLDGLKANATALGDKMNVQNQIIAKYAEQLSKSKEALEQNSQKLVDNKSKVESARKAYEDSVTSIGKNADETKKLKEELSKAESAFKSSENVVRNNNNTINGYTIQLNNAKGALNKMDSELTENNSKMKMSESSVSKLKSSFLGLANQSKTSSSSITGHLSSLKSTIMGFATTALAGLSLKSIIESTDAAEKTMAQMDAVLKSTGNAAGMTKQQLSDLATAQSKVTTYSAGMTKQAENMLLTFTNIKSDVFPQTVKATEDMATALGMNATDAAKSLGKALNDPAAGLSKLTKQGVTFTAAQKEQIKAMQKAGDTAGAQKVILQELEKEFGGSAKAAGQTFTGQIQIMTNSLKSAGVTAASALIPIANKLMPMVVQASQGLANAIKSHKDDIQNAANTVGNVIKGIFNFVTEHGELVKNVVIGITTAVVAWKVAIGLVNTVQTISNGLQALGIIQSGAAATAKVAETAATTGATVAQWSLNAAMDANPIGAVIAIIAVAVAAIAALTVGIIALVKHFQESSIETQKFGDNVSKSTQKAVTSFNDLNTKADTALKQLAWSGGVVTKKMADTITTNINAMADQTIKAFNKQRDGSIKAVTDLAVSTGAITKAEADTMVANINKGYDDRIAKETQAKTRIDEIINTAANEHRAKTQQENAEIDALHQQMYTAGIQSLSKNQVEEQAIFDNMRINHTATSAEEAATIVKNSKDTTDKVVADANSQYNNVVASIIRERDEMGTIKADEADKLIKAAQKQRDESVTAAQDMHGKVVSEAQAQAGDLVNKVDWQNGQVKSKWKVFCDGWVETWSYMKERSSENWVNIQNGWNEFWDGFSSGAKSGWNSFTNSWNNFWGGIHDAFTNLHPIQWGKDLMNGIAKGIKDAASAVGDAAKGVAQDIRKFLHFSVPDEGPLVDYETWMPDMMGGLAKGIQSNKFKVTNALKSLTSDMSLNINSAGIPRSKLNGISNSTTNNTISNTYYSSPTSIAKTPTIIQLIGNSKVMAEFVVDDISTMLGTTTKLQLRGATS